MLEPGPVSAAFKLAGRALLASPKVVAAALPFAWMSAIWWLSERSFDTGEPDFLFAVVANLMHAPLYGLLALFWAGLILRRPEGGWPRPSLGEALMLVCLPLAYGVLDEWHQSFVPGRHPSVMDLLTDAVGAGATIFIIRYLGAGGTERGLYRRLALGVVACVLAATAGVIL